MFIKKWFKERNRNAALERKQRRREEYVAKQIRANRERTKRHAEWERVFEMSRTCFAD